MDRDTETNRNGSTTEQRRAYALKRVGVQAARRVHEHREMGKHRNRVGEYVGCPISCVRGAGSHAHRSLVLPEDLVEYIVSSRWVTTTGGKYARFRPIGEPPEIFWAARRRSPRWELPSILHLVLDEIPPAPPENAIVTDPSAEPGRSENWDGVFGEIDAAQNGSES